MAQVLELLKGVIFSSLHHITHAQLTLDPERRWIFYIPGIDVLRRMLHLLGLPRVCLDALVLLFYKTKRVLLEVRVTELNVEEGLVDCFNRRVGPSIMRRGCSACSFLL